MQLNAPFSVTPAAGAAIGCDDHLLPATDLPSVSIFDYWSPATAVQRILCGRGGGQIADPVNGDFHEFEFSGLAQDVIDSASFRGGQGQLTSFPAEPAIGAFDYSIVPGNLGQAWLGSGPDQFFTMTSASVAAEERVSTCGRGSSGRACRGHFARDSGR